METKIRNCLSEADGQTLAYASRAHLEELLGELSSRVKDLEKRTRETNETIAWEMNKLQGLSERVEKLEEWRGNPSDPQDMTRERGLEQENKHLRELLTAAQKDVEKYKSRVIEIENAYDRFKEVVER